MKKIQHLTIASACGLFCSTVLHAEEPAPEITGLREAAADFVTAYNRQDAAALAELFTKAGEISDFNGSEVTAGRAAIQARYEGIFTEEPRHMAIEVTSVRLVAPNLAIEDGIYHLTPGDDETAPPTSSAYTAVLAKNDAREWRIASTRALEDVTGAAGHLAPLADVLKGEWTHRGPEGVRLDLALGWDPTGTCLVGRMLTATADTAPQSGTIRIAWDASRKQILSWMFDSSGGFARGVWSQTDDGWMIRSEGTTADGETLASSQKLTSEGANTLLWTATHRVIAGEHMPDQTLRIARQTPEPGEN